MLLDHARYCRPFRQVRETNDQYKYVLYLCTYKTVTAVVYSIIILPVPKSCRSQETSAQASIRSIQQANRQASNIEAESQEERQITLDNKALR